MPIKDTKELRAFLTEQMALVASGKVDASQARSIANLAQQIYNTLNVELRTALAKSKLGEAKVEPVKFA